MMNTIVKGVIVVYGFVGDKLVPTCGHSVSRVQKQLRTRNVLAAKK